MFDPNIETIDQMLSIRKAIVEGNFVIDGGLTTVSWNSEGTSVTKQWSMSPEKLMRWTLECLRKLDPATYGRNVRRTVPQYCN